MARLCLVIGLLLSVLWLPACTVYGEKPVKALADATGAESLERALWHDIKTKDWKDVRVHMTSNFVFVSPEGKLDRDATLERFRKMDVKDYSIGDLTTELSGNVFVDTYTITLRGTIGGQPLPAAPQRRVSVWHQQKSGWMMISHAVVGSDANAGGAPGTPDAK